LREQKLRLGVIGLGKMGMLHASLLNVFPEVEIVAFCEKSAIMNRLFKKAFSNGNVKIVNDIIKLRGLDLDAIYITTPIPTHASIIKSLLLNGICRNLFVEKTLASNYTQSKELCEIAKSVGGITMVGYMKRFSVVFRKAKELLLRGDLGELQFFKSYAFSSDFLGLTKESKSSVARGGALSDLGCHAIDLTLWLLGQLHVRDVLSVVKNTAGSETSVGFVAVTSKDVAGRFEVSQSMPNYRSPEIGLSIEGSKGRIEVNDDRMIFLPNNGGAQQKWYRQDLNDGVSFSLGEPEYFRENQEFVNSLLVDQQCELSFENASKVDCLIDQVKARSEKQ
jgi:predicted dehydrogenase